MVKTEDQANRDSTSPFLLWGISGLAIQRPFGRYIVTNGCSQIKAINIVQWYRKKEWDILMPYLTLNTSQIVTVLVLWFGYFATS